MRAYVPLTESQLTALDNLLNDIPYKQATETNFWNIIDAVAEARYRLMKRKEVKETKTT